jgi:tartrate-resistant acid phosphatase type 5
MSVTRRGGETSIGRMTNASVRSRSAGSRRGQSVLIVLLAVLVVALPLLAQSAAGAQGSGTLSFLVVSDLGGKGGSNQVAVATQMGRTAAARNCRFVVTCGDNYHGNGIDSADSPRWQTEFEEVYKARSLMIPWYATLGNHEYRGKPDAEVAYSQRSPRWKMPAHYYAHTEKIDEANEALFVHLDTAPFVSSYHKKGSSYHVAGQDTKAQLQWLESVLAGSPARWKLVVGHHPIYAAAGGHGDTKEMVGGILPLLEKHGVQMYFCGHDHVLQHLAHGKVNFFVCGGGSTHRTVKERPDVKFGVGSLGFLSVTLTAEKAEAAYINSQGNELYRARMPAQ